MCIRDRSIDDRTINKGDLFIAIIGDKFDGHDFIENAIKKGAYGIIVSNKIIISLVDDFIQIFKSVIT